MGNVEIEESQVLLDLWRHREEFYERTKDLSPEALARLLEQEAEEFMKTYNLNLPRAESRVKTKKF